MGKTTQHSVTSHYTANNFAEAKIIKHISTNLQNRQINTVRFVFQEKSKIIILRKAEGMSISSIDSFNHYAVKKQFNTSLLVMEIDELVERQIFNMDKPGICTV